MRTPSATLSLPPDRTPVMEQDLLDQFHLVRSIARRIHKRLPSKVDFEDLYSAGLVGLVEANATFDPAKNIKFAGYAQFRIRGAILDSLRLSDWAPRRLRHEGRAVGDAIRVLTARLGREPAEDDVAAELKISLAAYQKLLGDLNGLLIGTLHRTYDEDSGEEYLDYIQGKPEDDSLFHCMREERKYRLTRAIEGLSSRERLVITSYYYEEMTMPEIGLLLGVNWRRVRQIHASAVLHLRFQLSDFPTQRGHDTVRRRRARRTSTEHPLLSKSAA